MKLRPDSPELGYDLSGMQGIKSFDLDGSVCYFNPCHDWLARLRACPDCYGPKNACSGGRCTRKRRKGGGPSSTSAADAIRRIRARG